MNQKLRIRADLELAKMYEWPNPKPPKPLKDPAKKFQREQERLDKDAAAFKARCEWNQL